MKKNKRLTLTVIISLLIIFCCIYASERHISASINNQQAEYSETSEVMSDVTSDVTSDVISEDVLNSLDSYNRITNSENKDLRKFTYPYNAMLAFSSDIDDATLEEFKTYHKFLNTKEETPYGEGLGLDVGDSMWMYMANDTKDTVDSHGNGVSNIITFYKGIDSTQKHNADEITKFIKAGWIDSLHTLGDFSTDNETGTSFNRQLAIDSWNTLKSIDSKLTIWIDHGNRSNQQNFGAHGTSKFMNYQQGDNPKSSCYHTDLTIDNGVKYIWNSISEDKFGCDDPLYKISLRDGRKVWGFHRYTNETVNGKTDWTWYPENLDRQLTQIHLDSLVKKNQYSIVTQHFGVHADLLYSEKNIKALRMLKDYETNGKIIVAKTARLLNYANVHKNISYAKATENDKTYINIDCIDDPIFGKSVPTLDEVRGITFYCDYPEKTVLLLNKGKIDQNEIQINPEDETGKKSISIKWFKPDYTDYSK